jgi:hypothetical protein
MKKIILVTVIFWFGFTSIAEADHCPQTISAGKGSYPIREVNFTKEKAESSLKYINLSIKNGIKFKNIAYIKNKLTMIEGYLLLAQINEKNPESKILFCNFIKNKAFLYFK